ncbi:CU044_2847 family protein [Leptolyngbyaceae cyanobacterium UHCC 1019]
MEEAYLAFEADGQVHEMTITAKSPTNDEYERYGPMEDAIAQMDRTRLMIRTCAIQAVSAFRNFGAADVQEVSLKFGVKLGGKAGVPYITEGSAESNLEISVKCTFPPKTVPPTLPSP